MIEIEKIADLQKALNEFRSKGLRIGFVPTMGALHKGHLALIELAKEQADVVVCSIYINDLQFNNASDFENYPNLIEQDKSQLMDLGCDLLYLPVKEELFHEKPLLNYDLGKVGEIMEGEYRPGHFQGMASVVERFLRIIEPDVAIFGEKDFQQFAIVRWLVQTLNLPTKVMACPTIRTKDGLALSSRNLRLSAEELQVAPQLYRVFQFCKEAVLHKPIAEVLLEAKDQLRKYFKVEYLEIVDANTFESLEQWNPSKNPRIFGGVCLGEIRLIDNLSLID